MHTRSFIAIAALLSAVTLGAKTVEPTIKSHTSFAIFIDSKTYEALESKVLAYRDAIERDGLATYIVAEQFNTPEEVKEHIVRLHSQKKMPLEGVVFVGDIPVVMVRDGQHMASAFKMDQDRPWKESSIPSDRFYDDFDLRFKFLKQDEDVPSLFYYSVTAESAANVTSEIYSARVRAVGDDAFRKIGIFLDKAVKAHAEVNPLDRMFVFTGHGYNSEAFDAWSGEQTTLREQLPSLFGPGSRIQFARHDQVFPLKNYLLEQLKDEEMDIVIGHHHGATDTQYLNGYKVPASNNDAIDYIRRYLRSKTVGKKNQDQLIAEFKEQYGINDDWFDTSDSTRIQDDIYNNMLDMYIPDIYDARPNARFVVFDACYNGSFHLDDCVAYAYIYSEGKTVCVQGNSVNSLQDRIPDRYIGVLGLGATTGQWARLNQTVLETHLIGDPTLRFAGSGIATSRLMVSGGEKEYRKLLKDDKAPADLQAVSLRRLYELGVRDIRAIISDCFYNSSNAVVRNEAYTLMQSYPGPEFNAMTFAALTDNYELIRRLAANNIGRIGTTECCKAIAEALLDNKFSKRVSYQLNDAVSFMDPDCMKQALADALSRDGLMPDTGKDYEAYASSIDYTQTRIAHYYEEGVIDRELKLKSRRNEVRYYRNYHHHNMVTKLIEVALDESEPEELRICVVEALGWFRFSVATDEILDLCDKLIAAPSSDELKEEAAKTKRRLMAY